MKRGVASSLTAVQESLRSFRYELHHTLLHLKEYVWFEPFDERDPPGAPVKTAYLIGENHARDGAGVECDFKGIPFGVRSDGAHKCKARLGVIQFWGHDNGRTLLRLLMPLLRTEVHPDHIAPLRNVGDTPYH